MKLLVVTHYFSTHRGGVEIVAHALAEQMAERGLTVCWGASDCDAAPHPLPQRLRCVPMRSSNAIEERLQVPYPLWSPAALRCLYKLVRWADVVHIHDFAYAGNIFAMLFAKAQGRPVLITQHVSLVPYESVVLRSTMRLANDTLGRWLLGWADRVVFVSAVVRSDFDRRTRFRRAPLLIPNGVDTTIFRPTDSRGRRHAATVLQAPEGALVCLFVGRFIKKKGLHILRRLAENFPDTWWVFAGWGPLSPERWGLPNVDVITDRSGRDLVPLYWAADLLVLPSVGEGFPLVVQEAMCCGTPAFVSRRTMEAQPDAGPLMIHEEVNERGPSDETVAAWSARIATLRENREGLEAMRDPVASFALKHWSRDACVDRYMDILEQLCAAPRRALAS